MWNIVEYICSRWNMYDVSILGRVNLDIPHSTRYPLQHGVEHLGVAVGPWIIGKRWHAGGMGHVDMSCLLPMSNDSYRPKLRPKTQEMA